MKVYVSDANVQCLYVWHGHLGVLDLLRCDNFQMDQSSRDTSDEWSAERVGRVGRVDERIEYVLSIDLKSWPKSRTPHSRFRFDKHNFVFRTTVDEMCDVLHAQVEQAVKEHRPCLCMNCSY